jgi:2-polyprenyl-3-methyl-5-hydroxy-6-metoxy-1,4-benzoquinol methylase
VELERRLPTRAHAPGPWEEWETVAQSGIFSSRRPQAKYRNVKPRDLKTEQAKVQTNLLLQQKQELSERWGPWTAANVHLGGGVYTIDPTRPCSSRLIRFTQLISDLSGQPWSTLRVLDLACLEGEYAIEMACRGAHVVGIEGRAANIEKARFAKDVLRLDNLELIQDDVRSLSREKYGLFDIVLCSGILYHLDAPDVARFIHRISEVCSRWAIIDTHVSKVARESFVYEAQQYWGTRFIEHHAKSTAEERERGAWASLDNLSSFWFTRPSLYNVLTDAGFTSVAECHIPQHVGLAPDRLALVAVKGTAVTPASAGPCPPPPRWPERQPRHFSYFARRHLRTLVMRLPKRLARVAKRFAGP